MKLSPAIHQFFDRYLPHIKGVSEHTLKAYRDAFKLFLIFAAAYYRIKIRSLRLEHITAQVICRLGASRASIPCIVFDILALSTCLQEASLHPM